jgi:hypothetical protein
VISIELEDVPGGGTRNQSSTSVLERETMLAREYIAALCEEVGIIVET